MADMILPTLVLGLVAGLAGMWNPRLGFAILAAACAGVLLHAWACYRREYGRRGPD